jgi:hypothetical protein
MHFRYAYGVSPKDFMNAPRFVDLVGMHAVVFHRSQQKGTVLRPQVFAGGLFAIDGVLSETFCQLSRISNRHGSPAPVTLRR